MNFYANLEDDENTPKETKPRAQQVQKGQAAKPAAAQEGARDRLGAKQGGQPQVSEHKERRPRGPGGKRERTAPRHGRRNDHHEDGTGRGHEHKKHGGGKGGAGNIENQKDLIAENEVQAGEPAPAPVVELSEEEKKAIEEEAKRKTLDEYLSAVKKPVISLPPPRKANEGADSKKWATVELKKEDEADKKVAAEKKKDSKEEKDAKPAITAEQIINFTTTPPAKPRRDNRGPKGPKGPKGGQKNSRQSAPNLADNQNFPPLATKA